MITKTLAMALIGIMAITSGEAHAENLPANTVPILPGATVRSIKQEPCLVSVREWTHGSEAETVAFYANWAVSKGLIKSDKASSSSVDRRLLYFVDSKTNESLTLMLSSDTDHNYVSAMYDVGTTKSGCPDSPMIR